MPEQLINENQETMFDNPLSNAADAYLKSVAELKLWKAAKDKFEKELIAEMNRCNVSQMNIGLKLLTAIYKDATEKISVKDIKPNKQRKNGQYLAGQ